MIILALAAIGFLGFLELAAREGICLDRPLWCRPPENPEVYTSGLNLHRNALPALEGMGEDLPDCLRRHAWNVTRASSSLGTRRTLRSCPGLRQGSPRSGTGCFPPKNAEAWLQRPKDPQQPSTATAMEGSESVLVDARGVDARHDTVGIATEPAQLLG